jgi:hypothetical protein
MSIIILPVIDTDAIGWTFNSPTDALASVIAKASVTTTSTSLGGGVQLINDATTPGANKYYGTDSGGTKGFITLPVLSSVTTLAAQGSTPLTGAVTLAAGSGVTITEAGQIISIAASVTSTAGFVSGSGVAAQVAYWTGTQQIKGNTVFTFNETTLHVPGLAMTIGADVAVNRQTLSADKTLTTADKRYQNLNPNGSARNVTLPALAEGLAFFVVNSGTLAEVVTLKTSGATSIATITNNESLSLISDGTVWIAVKATGIVLV